MLAKYPFSVPIIHAQNPEDPNPANVATTAHQIVRARAALQYAASKGYLSVNALQAFLNHPTWLADWMGNSVHPNQAGHDAWFEVEKLMLGAILGVAA